MRIAGGPPSQAVSQPEIYKLKHQIPANDQMFEFVDSKYQR